jgi:hypothetical protein
LCLFHFVFFTPQKHKTEIQGVPFIASPSLAAVSHTKPASIEALHNNCRAKKTAIRMIWVALALRIFALTSLFNIHYFLIYALSFSVLRPLAGCAILR